MSPIYLDNAATTPITPEVRAALAPFLDTEFGNPSSRYPLGVRAAEAIDRSRALVARASGAEPRDVYFTAGGTEANSMAVLGAARARRGKVEAARVVFGPTEHPCVRNSALALAREGFDVVQAPLDRAGALDLAGLEELLDERCVLVAQMLVNNEFGSLYPVREVSRMTRKRAPHAHVHVDAVQGLGKVDVSIDELGADTLAFSGHKLHAPKGVGALVTRGTVALEPVIYGGGQEHGVRSGTENVAGIVAFGAAASAADDHLEASQSRVRNVRAALVQELDSLDGAAPVVAGPSVDFVCAVELPGPPAEVWQHHLEARGVYTSVGSACQSNTGEVSGALRALGFDERRARQVMRFSFSRYTTEDDVERAARTLHELAPELRAATR
ncbi:MAG: cysteine desulfurase [bacterium]|nr:cysteine desulfurase [bacterium]